jgi:chromosomal replication initiator protein
MPQAIWNECLKLLADKVKKESFSTWFRPTRGLEINDDSFMVAVPNQFVADWLKDHYWDEIVHSLRSVCNCNLRVVFKINSGLGEKNRQMEFFFRPAQKSHSKPANGQMTQLDHTYNFETFVVGESNQFARAAALAVAEAPGQTRYNPFYVYGGVGLGKTHLTQAIGNFVACEQPLLRVIYATSEKFTNDFISSLGNSNMSAFNQLYRNADLLLLDDIQFFAGKEATQIQFFHTFNALHLARKQIVLTSDRPPKEIKGLEERLLSRFQWGLVTDIQPPDLETRIAILNKKAEVDGASLPKEAATYIAENFTSNVRELEGALVRALAFASIWGRRLDLELAQEALAASLNNGRKEVYFEDILKQVAFYYQLSPQEIVSKRKTAEVAWARQVGMFVARELTDFSLKYIGAQFGGRDHSTVIHACSAVKRALKTEPDLKRKVDQIISSLYAQ